MKTILRVPKIYKRISIFIIPQIMDNTVSLNLQFIGPLGQLQTAINTFNSVFFNDQFHLKFLSRKALKFFVCNFNSFLKGIYVGFFTKIKFEGVGFRSWNVNNHLYLQIGYNAIICYQIPTTLFFVYKKKAWFVFVWYFKANIKKYHRKNSIITIS